MWGASEGAERSRAFYDESVSDLVVCGVVSVSVLLCVCG